MRVLLIDDDHVFTAMISEYLQSEEIHCERESDPLAGLGRALSGQHDAIVLDVMMPGTSGLDVLRAIRRETDLPVLMLTARGDGIDRVVGLEIGADDYIPKPVYPRELVARLRAVLRRAGARSSGEEPRQRIEIGPLTIQVQQRECRVGERPVSLTATEFDLLRELAVRAEEVVSKDELSQRALQRPREPYDRSVDVHISNLRHKLKDAEAAVEIETVRGVGYRIRRLV